jgi:hypothetical protein
MTKSVFPRNSSYRHWLRNVHTRRLYILLAVPVALPFLLVFSAIRGFMAEGLPVIVEAWRDDRSQPQ